jgi:uncharacterized cupredoxin-like copper-binding protein
MEVLHLRPARAGRLVLWAVLLLALGLLAAACGVTTPTNEPAAATATTAPAATATAPPAADTPAPTAGGNTGGTEIAVTLNEWSIEPKQIDVAGGQVSFKVTNSGNLPHDFVILNGTQEVAKSRVLNKGETDTMTVDLPAGSFTTVCDLTGHKEAGMVGTLTVK